MKIVKRIKSITAREIFKRVPTVKEELWGGAFWTKGYFISTVGRHGREDIIRQYVENQGRQEKDYTKLQVVSDSLCMGHSRFNDAYLTLR